MATAPRQQLASRAAGRKQFKRTYKIPRSLKKAIKKNLYQIVKEREREIRDEEHEKASIHHKAFLSGICSNLSKMIDLWDTYGGSDELGNELEIQLAHSFYTVGFETARQNGGLPAQTAFARRVLEKRLGIEDLYDRIRAWLIEQGEDAVEVEKLGKEAEVKMRLKMKTTSWTPPRCMTGPLHPLWSDEEAKPSASNHMDALDTSEMD
ncbi:hypothetical protein M436DRAFT_63313 [Aureobasidium namibiae CBS 147.97]|uniref:Uncharacterized protein n=1 Tax=Aureobasidium namibiae CBS 147.97 TaxID=1043004 RepID=A0A074XHB8_9PEZI